MINLLSFTTSPLPSHFINALGWTLIHSLWQFALINFLLLAFLKSPFAISGQARANCCRLGLVGGVLFNIATFIQIQLSVLNHPFAGYSARLGDGHLLAFHLVPGTSHAPVLMPYLLLAWLSGCLLCSLWHLYAYLHCLDIRKQAHDTAPERLSKRMQYWAQHLGIGKPVQLRLSNLVAGPCVMGHFKPVILLPCDAVLGHQSLKLSQAAIEFILLHELAHIKRWDYLFSHFQYATKTLYFFNPCVWLINRQLNIEREHACDDIVVEHTQQPMQYAHTLKDLAMMKKINRSALSTFTLSATKRGFQLLQRIRRLTRPAPSPQSATPLTSSLFTLSTLTLIVLGFSQLGVVPANANPELESIDASSIKPDILPIEYRAAVYPSKAIAEKIEGYCIVQYSVNTLGEVENPRIDKCDVEGYFEEASLAAALTFKYSPQTANNKIVRVNGVKNRFDYKLK